jgi:hypothetical protein
MLFRFSALLILFPIVIAAPPRETTDLRFLYQCVDQHNIIRNNDGLDVLLEFDRELEEISRERAELMAASGKLLLPLKDIPENSAFVPIANETISCRDVVSYWFQKGLTSKASQKTANTTVRKNWDKLSRIGCARFFTEKPELGSYVVCNYGLSSR